jgi:hypothetical protein
LSKNIWSLTYCGTFEHEAWELNEKPNKKIIPWPFMELPNMMLEGSIRG